MFLMLETFSGSLDELCGRQCHRCENVTGLRTGYTST
jgi:hypothetical protein